MNTDGSTKITKMSEKNKQTDITYLFFEVGKFWMVCININMLVMYRINESVL